jgi:YfiH family protein
VDIAPADKSFLSAVFPPDVLPYIVMAGTHREPGLPCVRPISAPEFPGVAYWFTTRHAGPPRPDGFHREDGVGNAYEEFNLADHVDDNPDHVAHNRARLLAAIQPPAVDGAPPFSLHLLRQVHGAHVVTIPQGAAPQHTMAEGDALVTNQRRMALGIFTADCFPVLFVDPEARCIGAAHAGWRGAVAGVTTATLEAMEILGARRSRIHAMIGPGIHAPSYEVGPGLREEFLRQTPGNGRFFTPVVPGTPGVTNPDHFLLDLPGYLTQQLVDGGILQQRIHPVSLCTHAHNDLFFSHRNAVNKGVQGCGRQLAVIYVE